MFSVGRTRTSTDNTKLNGESNIFFHVQRHMSLLKPNESYHFQANLIWWDSPFKNMTTECQKLSVVTAIVIAEKVPEIQRNFFKCNFLHKIVFFLRFTFWIGWIRNLFPNSYYKYFKLYVERATEIHFLQWIHSTVCSHCTSAVLLPLGGHNYSKTEWTWEVAGCRCSRIFYVNLSKCTSKHIFGRPV